MMNMIGCLDVPTSGRYVLDSVEVSTLSEDELAYVRNQKIGFIFQNFNLLPRMTAIENVELPMLYMGVPARERRERAMAALERVGLQDRMHNRPNELSGGQQQRVAIARAIVNHPSMILGDEPTGALDSKTTEDILSLLHELHEQGNTIILVTHDAEVGRHAERLFAFATDGWSRTARSRMRGSTDVPGNLSRGMAQHPGQQDAFVSHHARDHHWRDRCRAEFGHWAEREGGRDKAGGKPRFQYPDGHAWGGDGGWRQPRVWGGVDTRGRGCERDRPAGPGRGVRLAHGHCERAGDLRRQQPRASIEGTSADYPAIRNVTLAMGRYFLPSEVQDAANVAVLGSQAYQTLFSGVGTNPIGQTIEIGGIPFTVVGVAASQGASGFSNQDDAIAIPYTTAMNLFSGGNTVNEILVAAKSPDVMDRAQLEIESTLRAMHGLAPSQSDDFQIVNQATILNALSGVSRILTLLLDGISAISLLVGGIGIMNIMLVSVTERTREIGIRKAIGATPRVISAQFLTEATMLSVAGAMAGLILAGIGTAIMSKITGDGNLFSPVAAVASLGFSIAVGLIFGVYPARKAARLKPIDALRFE